MKASLWTLVLVAVLTFACVSLHDAAGTQTNSLTKRIVPGKSGEELKINFKLFLVKMKLRRVPLTKERTEKLLTKLLSQERLAKESISKIESNLKVISDKSKRKNMLVFERQGSSDSSKSAGGKSLTSTLMVAKELTQSRIDEWQAELEKKQRELQTIRDNIDKAKKIIRNPESFISVPHNYGHLDPEEVRKAERERLVEDRLNMELRAKVELGEMDPPLWLTDSW